MVNNKIWTVFVFVLFGLNVQAQLANWTDRGLTKFPKNIGGQINGMSRTNELVFHATDPLKMYAISVEGGLYLTTNGGDSWLPAAGTENMIAKSASVCVDSRNDQIMLLGTGDPNYYYSFYDAGNGIYRSTDGGATFTPTSLKDKLVLKILQNPINPDVYIAATESGMYRSSDNGLTWTLSSNNIRFNDLVKNPFPTSLTLYATNVETNSAFYRSYDFGLSWEQITSGITGAVTHQVTGGGRVGVTIADTSVVYFEVIAGGGIIHKSTNGGTTFSVVKGEGVPFLTYYGETGGPGQGNYNNTFWVDSRDANKMWLQSHNTWYSSNGGVNWTMLTHWTTKVHTDMHHIKQSPFDPAKLYSCNDGGIFLSTDGGNNWVPKCDGFYAYEIVAGAGAASKTNSNYIMIGTQDNGRLYRDSIGWYTNEPGDDYGYKAADYLPLGGNVYFYEDGISKRYSINRKQNYSTGITTGTPVQFAFSKLNTDLGLSLVKINNVLKYYRTLDLSTIDPANIILPTWTELTGINNTDPINFIHCSAANKEKAYFVVKNKIYITNNISASTPSFLSYDLPSVSGTIQCIASNASNENLIYLLNDRKVFESRNSGQTWTDITFNLPNVDHRAVLAEEYGGSEELIFVATNNAVYYKKSGQNSWTIYTTNLPKRKSPTTFSMYDDGTNRSLLRYFSFGKAVYETPFDNLRVLDAQIDFVGSNKQTCANSKVKFADFSLGKINQPITKYWSFPGGTPSSSTDDSPEVTYPKSGYYNVSFSVNDGVNKTSTKIFKKYVEVEKCIADTVPGNALVVGNTRNNYGQSSVVALGTSNTLTLMSWIKIDTDQPDWAGIIFSGSGGSGLKFARGNQLFYEWDGYYGFQGDGAGPIVPKGKWNHVALVITSTSATLYLNGVPYVNDRNHVAVNFDQGFNLGNDRNDIGRTMIGKMDEVVIYNRALTTDEIRSNMYFTKQGTNDLSLKAYFQFNEDENTIKDWSGNNVGLTILNAGTHNTVRSTAPVGKGLTQKLSITSSGIKSFNQVGAELNFGSGTYPDGEVYITVLNQQPPKVPSLVNKSNLSKRYWLINNYGNNADITAPIAFKFLGYGTLNSDQVSNPANFKLQYLTNGLTDDSTLWVSPNISASNVIANSQEIQYTSFALPTMASMDQIIALSINQDIVYYRDYDGDGFGDPNLSINSSSVTPSVGYVQNNTDCDDTNAAINPNAEEVFGNNIDENCDGIIQHTITATTGSISPAGTMFVNNGASLTYTITPINCYEIRDVLVDGVSVGNVTSYTFNSISQNHSITAVYSRLLPGAAGAITGPSLVCGNEQHTYSIPVISGATSYTWTLPDGTITSTNSNSLVYTIPSISRVGEISVYGVNACGSGTSTATSIQVNTLPPGFELTTPSNIILGDNLNSKIKTASVALDGSDDYISTNLNLSNLNSFTIEGRVNLNDNNADLFGQDDVIEFNATSTQIKVWTPWGGSMNWTYDNRFAPNKWHHLALVGNGSILKLYLDGYNVASTNANTSNYGVSANTSFMIGANISGGYLNGKVDEVRVWNIARTAQEIFDNKDIELVGTQNGLLAYYKMNHGIANENNSGVTTVTDYSNNSKDGILNHSALSGSTSNWVAEISTLTNPWTTSNNAIFTVSNQGAISTISTGLATLTYSFENCAYGKAITVASSISGGTISGTTDVCAGTNSSTLLLNGSLGNVQWQSSLDGVNYNNIIGANQTTYTAFNLTNTTTFRAVVSSATYSETSNTAIVTVKQSPTAVIVASSSTSFCQGGNVTLTASDGNTYLWNTGEITKSITTSNPGNYNVTISNSNGCSTTSANTTVNIYPLPTNVVASTSTNTVLTGSQIMLSASASVLSNSLFNSGFEEAWSAMNGNWFGQENTNNTNGRYWIQSGLIKRSGFAFGGYQLNTALSVGTQGDTYAYTKGLNLTTGFRYTISFWYAVTNASYPQKLKLTVGNNKTIAAQNQVLWDNNGQENLTNTTWKQAIINFIPSNTGTYYFGFDDYTPAASNNNQSDRIYIDDVSIQENPIIYSWTSNPSGFTSNEQNPILTVNRNTDYILTVTNGITNCSSSSTVSISVLDLPTAPTSLAATVISGGISISFTPSTTSTPMPTIYQYSTDGGVTWSDRNDGGTTGSPLFIDKLSSNINTSLTEGVAYSIKLRAVNPVGVGAPSIVVTATPNVNYTAPSLISPLNNAIKQATITTISWSNVNGATEYTLQYGTDPNLTTGINSEVLSSTSKTLTNLTTNTNYYWRVKAQNGNYTSIYQFQTIVQVPVLEGVYAGNKVDTLNWSLSDANRIKYFKIIRYTNTDAIIVLDSVDANKRSYVDNKNLNLNTKYYYKVVAGNMDNVESEISNIISATPFNTRPRAVVLSSQSFSNSQDTSSINYTYSATGSTDADGVITEYRWFINDSLVNKSIIHSDFTYKYGNGTTKVKLIVVDNDNAVDSSSAEIKVTTVAVTLGTGTGVLGGITAVNSNLILTADTSSVGSSGSSTIYKMDRFGNVLNTITVAGKITTTPSVSSDSSLYITSGTSISSFDKNGISKWAPITLDGAAKVTPTVDSVSGNIYVGTVNNKFYSIDAKRGKIGWTATSDAPIYTSAMITGDRRLVFVSESGTFYGFDIYADTSATKNAKWRLALGEVVTKSGAIDHSQNLYYGTTSGKIIKIKMGQDGTTIKLWSTQLSDSILASPVLDGKGRLYAGSKDGKLYRLDPNTGSIQWIFAGEGSIQSTPSISNYGTVIFATSSGNIYALDSNMKIKWLHKEGAPISANILYIKNMVYFATEQGKYFGLYDDPKAFYNPTIISSSNVNNTIIQLNKTKSASIVSNNAPVISLIRQLDQSTTGLVTEMPMWGTFQGNAQRTGVQIPDCPEIPIIRVPLCYEVVDSVKLTTNDLINKKWVINDVVLSNYKDSIIKIKPTDKFDLQTTSIYGCTINGSDLQYNMSSLISAPLISSNAIGNLCIGDSVILSLPASPNKYVWNSLGGSVKDYIGNTLKVSRTDQYFVSEINDFGCKSTSEKTVLTFRPIPAIPNLSRDASGALISSADFGNIWFKDGVQISDTTKTIKPSQVGSYKVKSSILGCTSSLSTAYFFLVTDIIHLDKNQFIRVTPNPFLHKLNVDFLLNGYQKMNIEINNLYTGLTVFYQENVYPGAQLQVHNLSSGAYILRAYSLDRKVDYQFKLIKVN